MKLRFEVPMQTWKKIAVFGAIGAGAAMVLSGRRALGAALATGGLALLASEYPEKFEDLVEDAPEYLNRGIELLATLKKVGEGSPHVVDEIRAKSIAMVVNTTQGAKEVRDSYSLRRQTLLANIPYFTTMSAALAVVQSLEADREDSDVDARSLQEWHEGS